MALWITKDKLLFRQFFLKIDKQELMKRLLTIHGENIKNMQQILCLMLLKGTLIHVGTLTSLSILLRKSYFVHKVFVLVKLWH